MRRQRFMKKQRVPLGGAERFALEREEFSRYVRSDGQVGTRNYWLVVPLVFCENRNILDDEAGV